MGSPPARKPLAPAARRGRIRAVETKRQLTRLSILTTISQALSANLELDPLLETVHREVSRLFDTTNFLIALYRTGAPEWGLVFRMEHGIRAELRRHTLDVGLTGYTIRSGQALLVQDYRTVRAQLEGQGIRLYGEEPRSWMCVPLKVADRVVGAMAIQNYEVEGAYNHLDLELFTSIASQIAVAIRNAQLYEDSERRAREMEMLAETGRSISSSLDVETVLGRAATGSLALISGDSLAIFLKEPEGDLKAVAAAGSLAGPLLTARIKPGTGILGAILSAGVSEIVNDASGDPRVLRLAGTPPNEPGEKLMAAPLVLDGAVIGLISVWRKNEHPVFEEADLRFLESLGRQATVAIWNARLFSESRRAQAEAETANKAKTSFLASMSHELRTPLNAIILYSELLRDEVTERGLGELSVDLVRIQNAGKHLLGLIDDILDLSKIEAGKMAVVLEDFALPELLAEVASTAQPLVERNRNRFVLDADASIQEIHSDLKKVRQIIFNLLGNAAKFTTDGVIRLRVGRDPLHVGRLVIIVSDTGIGMDRAQMDRLFQEFAQAEEVTSRNYGGTGLGLALCRKFTDLLGGQIQVESEPGRGTSFIVTLPVLPAPRPEAPVREAGLVLVIDEDEGLRRELGALLAGEGYEMLEAADGDEGLALARSRNPHIIILDFFMPGQVGWQVLRQLKADPGLKAIPVVILTVLEGHVKGITLDGSEFLLKPVEREKLVAALSRLLPSGSPASVLIVEDDEATREGLTRILEAEGLHVHYAANGRLALEILGQERPGLIVLDLMMPEMDGFQLMDKVRERVDWNRIPVVVLTAAELDGTQRERLRSPQIRQVVRKGSYSRRELVELVKKSLTEPGN